MKVAVVFGAGRAFGLSVARRFGRDGFAVELVGRHRETLEPLAQALQSEDIPTGIEIADLSDSSQALEALHRIEGRRERTPDVVVYSPGDVSRLPTAALDLTSANLASWLPLNLLTPLDVIHAVLPGMIERGSGSVIVAQGAAVREPVAALASSSVAQAALLNYLVAVDADIRARGPRVASLQIGQLIERSAAAQLFEGGHFADVQSDPIPAIDPDTLAELVWELSTRTDARAELAS